MSYFSEDVIRKARDYLDGGRVLRQEAEGTFTVVGSKRYVVQTDADGTSATWASCSCPHARRAGAVGMPRCSHVCGVLLAVRDDRDLRLDKGDERCRLLAVGMDDPEDRRCLLMDAHEPPHLSPRGVFTTRDDPDPFAGEV